MPPDLRTRRRAETHQRIYEVGMRLFEEQGFDSVSVSAIATAARVSVPTFYAHYPSKDRIVLHVPDHEEMRTIVKEHSSAPSVTEQAEAMIRAWMTSFEGEAQVELLRQWRLVAHTRSLQLRAAEIEREIAYTVAEELGYPGYDETSLAVQLTLFSMYPASTQILMRWAAQGGRRPLAQVCEAVLAALRSLRAHPV